MKAAEGYRRLTFVTSIILSRRIPQPVPQWHHQMDCWQCPMCVRWLWSQHSLAAGLLNGHAVNIS